jgi:O-antigen/teichoic acid export membrane protein
MRENLQIPIPSSGEATFLRKVIESDFILKVVETVATRVMLIGIGLITSIIVTRILGPTGRGIYAIAITIGALGIQFGNLGLHASNTYSVAGKPELLPKLVSNSLLVSFLFGGLGCVLFWGVLLLWPSLVQIQGLLLTLSLVWIPFGLAYLLLQNLLVGIQDIRSYNLIELAQRVLSLLMVGAVILLHAVNVETIYLTGLVTLVASFIWTLRRLRIRLLPFTSPSVSLFKENLHYGIKAYVAALFAFLVLRVDLLIIQYMRGAEQTGFYSIAVAITDLVYLLPVIVGTILFPRLSAMSSDQERWRFARVVAQWVGLMMLVIAGVLALVAEPLVALLYGRSFLPAVPALIWLMPGIVMLSINTIYMNYFASIGMPLITIYSPASAAILNIVLNIKLIPKYGIVGASIASTVAYGMMFAISLVYLTSKGVRSVP